MKGALFLLLVLAAEKTAPRPPRPALPAAVPAAQTRCAACHTVATWADVRFDHDRTGFPLLGAHGEVKCRDCHAGRFDAAVPRTCAGCHRDRHAGELGLRCEGCHEETSWRPLHPADAHRRTLFPLGGKHALIPCQECHGNVRDRAFDRAPARCVACHRQDYDRTRATSIDHAAARFGTDCQSCHATWGFRPARFDGHDACFRISSGAHAGIRCAGCHTGALGATVTGACDTRTAACSGCHEHACAKSDRQHRDVMGYECRDRKCYECHRDSVR